MATESTVSDLCGKDLSGFRIVKAMGVYERDAEGNTTTMIAFSEDEHLAHSFADTRGTSLKTKEVLVLTNGTVGYVLNLESAARMLGESDRDNILRNIYSKLTLSQRIVAGLPLDPNDVDS